ncbi:DMT family transporter [Nocardiopsis sp. RSe5-2]|uniref:DMT family transporter n=1 Tax=Nocardiopsis endophytica TaxID=3018445 RepID=A0ABT4U994_9ACTN|nr:DMT family transporter [Nocardiopsis endophytica]MDA2813512.1 DMT family transporter [Nocardiopsis endophytica]
MAASAVSVRAAAAAAPAVFVLLWASGPLAVQAGLPHTTVPAFLFLRAAGAAALSWGVWALVRDPLPAGGRPWLRLGAVALLMQVVYQGFFFLALAADSPAATVIVIVALQPVLTAAVAAWTSGGRGAALWAGLALGVAGAALTAGAGLGELSGGDGGALGLACAFAALLGITAGTLVQGRASGTGLWASLALQSTLSAAVFAVVALAGGRMRFDWEPGLLVGAGWMAAVVSVGATALLYAMVARGEATGVTALFFCVPPVTALLEWAVHGRVPGPVEAAGMVCAAAAIAAVRRAPVGRPAGGARPGADRKADGAGAPERRNAHPARRW